MAKDWEYLDARTSSCGKMQCCSCGKKITEGRYRARQKSKAGDWRYVTQHEACSLDDREWAKIDDQQAKARRTYSEFVADCVAFREKWAARGVHVHELDEYCEETTEEADSHGK